jgi:hypothetical protein
MRAVREGCDELYAGPPIISVDTERRLGRLTVVHGQVYVCISLGGCRISL